MRMIKLKRNQRRCRATNAWPASETSRLIVNIISAKPIVAIAALLAVAAPCVADEPAADGVGDKLGLPESQGPSPNDAVAEQSADAMPESPGEADKTAALAGPDDTKPSLEDIDAAYEQFLRLREEDQTEDAVRAAYRVAELSRSRYGDKSIKLATPLINLAVMQSRTGDLPAAEQNYRAAIELIELREGALSSRLINPLSGLGHAYNRAGLYEQAIETFERALRLNNIELGFTNFEQFGIQDGLTESYVGMRDYEEASFYQEAQLEIYQRKFGIENPEIVPAMYKLAEWYSRAGNLEQSALTFRGADRILREGEGETSTGRADALLGLARLYERQGNRPAASSTLRKGIKLLDANPEPDKLRRAKLRVALGDLYTRESRNRSASVEYSAAWTDLSDGGDEYLDIRDKYFELPVRLAGGPFPTMARNTRGQPASALRDGYVEVRYTVDSEGRAQNVVVIEADPPDVMDDSLLATYQRSMFRPRVDDGQPVATDNLLSRHEFRYAVKLVPADQDEGALPRPPRSDRGRLDRPGSND